MSCLSSVTVDTGDHVVVQGVHTPTAQDETPPELPIDHHGPSAVSEGDAKGEPMPDAAGRHRNEQLAGGGGGSGGGGDPSTESTVVVGGDTPSQHVAANNSPPSTTTSRFDEACRNLNLQQLDECADLLLELLGWGVTLEYIADSGFSLPGVIWLCAKLRIRLSWGIIKRAREACIPLHELSVLPEGYVGPKPKPPPSHASAA